MTENKRFTSDIHRICDNNEEIACADTMGDAEILVDLLNEQEETINNLKKALWESEISYIEEKNEYSIDVERDIDWLKKEFEREYWND